MRISHKYKFVFLANPRTGSSSIRRLLDPVSDIRSVHIKKVTRDHPFYHHITAKELKQVFEENGWDWSAYRKFCVVRNPYDRLVSLYHFHLREKNLAKYLAATSWIEKVFDSNNEAKVFGRYVSRIKPQHKLPQTLKQFCCDDDGHSLVDNVLKFENLEFELPKLFEELGVPLDVSKMPKLNDSPGRDKYQKYYDAKTVSLVAKIYQYEIEKYNYSF